MTRREATAVKLGAGITVAALMVRLAAGPGLGTFGVGRDLRARLALLADTRRAIASLSGLEDSMAVLRKAMLNLAPALLSGSTEADALADLSARLGHTIQRAAGRLESTQPAVDSTRAGALRRVSIRAAFETDIRGLSAVLTALATGTAAFTPDSAEITALDPTGPETAPERLRVELTVAGWYQMVAK